MSSRSPPPFSSPFSSLPENNRNTDQKFRTPLSASQQIAARRNTHFWSPRALRRMQILHAPVQGRDGKNAQKGPNSERSFQQSGRCLIPCLLMLLSAMALLGYFRDRQETSHQEQKDMEDGEVDAEKSANCREIIWIFYLNKIFYIFVFSHGEESALRPMHTLCDALVRYFWTPRCEVGHLGFP